MSKENNSSLIFTLVGLALQATAWIWPNIDVELRVGLSIVSIVIVMFSQGGRDEGTRSWLNTIKNYLIVNYRLILSALISGAVIAFLSIIRGSGLLFAAQFILTGLLAASLSALISGQGREPSIRIVKGSSDKIYLLENRVKRLIPDPLTLAFVTLDVNRSIERISDLELNLYRDGLPLPNIASCDLVKGSGPEVYIIWEGFRKHIPDGPTLEYFFHDKQPRQLSVEDLEAIPRTGALFSIYSRAPEVTIRGDNNNIYVNR